LLDGEEPQATATIVGSLGFMPPEQAGAIAQPVTTASDVYGLGATLYFLLTGRAPYEAADLLSLLVCFNAGPPTRPKQLAPGIGDDLQRVCLAALEHDPARRYRTAAAFGEDLRRVLEGRPSEPPNEPPVTPWRRLHCGARRQPHVVFGLAMLVLFAWATYAMTVQSEGALRSAVLRTNAALAASRARTVLELLKQDEQTVQHAASDPVVQDYLTRATITNPAPRLAELAPGFDTVFVVDLEGAVCARWPGAAVQYYARRFKFRDYFKGAIALRGQGVHVSQAFHSEFDDDNLKFAISAPVRAADGKLLGIFVAARATAQTYRDVHFDDSFSSGQITAVLGPREPPKHATADDTPQKSLQFSVVMHSELKAAGSEYRVERGLSDRLQRRFPQSKPGAQLEQSDVSPELSENFHDPLMPGRWLAAIAPIGHTGYAVVCQTDYTTKGYPNLSTILPQVGLPVWLLLNFALLTRKILARRPR
jgi:serine/threonine-protein kinase